MATMQNYDNLTPCEFFDKPPVKRCLIKFIKKYGGGGGSGVTPDLQAVTTAGNITTDSIIVNAAVNGQIGAIGGTLANIVTNAGSSSIIVQSEAVGKNIITMTGTENFLDTGGGSLSISTGSGTSVLNTFINGQVTGANATDPNHFVTLSQLGDSGTTAERPGSPVLAQMFFDTTLGIPIWYNGTNWINAAGVIV
jgi:hypothetical protein